MNCSELDDNSSMDCAPYYQSPFMFSIDVKKEMYKAVEEERCEDAAMLRDGEIPESVLHRNVKMRFKPFVISTNDTEGLFT